MVIVPKPWKITSKTAVDHIICFLRLLSVVAVVVCVVVVARIVVAVTVVVVTVVFTPLYKT